MSIAVIGCGAIGGLMLGRLTEQGLEVGGVVKVHQKQAMRSEGLQIEGVGGARSISVAVDTQLQAKADFVIFATKINDLRAAVEKHYAFIKDATVLSTQNGVKADYVLGEYFPTERIITGIVMFGATLYPPNRVVHNFEGNLIIGNLFTGPAQDSVFFVEALSKAFTVVSLPNIKGAKYLKLFVNLNNCIPAALGISMQEAFSDLAVAELSIALNKEAYEIVEKSGIVIESLPDYPKQRLQGLLSMESKQAAGIFSGVMKGLSEQPLYGSILQSIKRGRPSEIDYINGEIVSLAERNKFSAPLNKRMVDIIHKVEESGVFLSKDQLLSQIFQDRGA